ncbi:MAG: galactokinase family protein [Butyricimonas faecihominis]
MDTGVLEQRFEEIYGTKVEHLYFAPGRVNLIGEHIDYNGDRCSRMGEFRVIWRGSSG